VGGFAPKSVCRRRLLHPFLTTFFRLGGYAPKKTKFNPKNTSFYLKMNGYLPKWQTFWAILSRL
jgi:hypothetical protein